MGNNWLATLINKDKKDVPTQRSNGAIQTKGIIPNRAGPQRRLSNGTEQKPHANDSNASRTPRFVTSQAQLPKYEKVISGSHGNAIVSVSSDIEKKVCVIDKGLKHCEVLFAHDQRTQLLPSIRSVEGQLIGAGYAIDTKGGVPCDGKLLAELFENDLRIHQRSRGDKDLATGNSKPKALWDGWIEQAVSEGATDLHIQLIGNKAEAKIRVDGELEFIRDASRGVYTSSAARMAVSWAYNNKTIEGTNGSSTFDGSANRHTMIEDTEYAGKRVSLRYQCIAGYQGPKIVCRILYVDVEQKTLSYEELGYEKSQQRIFRDVSYATQGVILISGITGSGKTTTMKTFMETHPLNGIDALYSVEDPVEYRLKNVHQISVQRDLLDQRKSAEKYSEIVSALVRADPTVIFMGEIRDKASALATSQMSDTGHQVAGTLHAHLISGIIPRLTNEEVGLSRDVLTNPNMLSLLIYQALVPKLCPYCKVKGSEFLEKAEDKEYLRDLLNASRKLFDTDDDSYFFKNPKGCSHCKGRGTKGLTVVAEMWAPDMTWLQLIRESKDHEALCHYRNKSDRNIRSPNMDGKTVFEHAVYKAINGIIDPRSCESFDSFRKYLSPDQLASLVQN